MLKKRQPILLILLTGLLVSACGQIGPLYKSPKPKIDNQQPSENQPTPSPSPSLDKKDQ